MLRESEHYARFVQQLSPLGIQLTDVTEVVVLPMTKAISSGSTLYVTSTLLRGAKADDSNMHRSMA